MTISTTILQAYDACKRFQNAETCRQQAVQSAPNAVNTFLYAYDGCLAVSSPEACRRLFAYDIPTPPIIPLIIGSILGYTIKK
jgi:hypothetical protein